MIQYSDTKLQELIEIAQESLSNGKILTATNELKKLYPEIFKEYSIDTHTKYNPESIGELIDKKDTINDIIFYSKIKLYENRIIQNTTKEKEEIYIQNSFEALKGYIKVQDSIIGIMELIYSRKEFEIQQKIIDKYCDLLLKYLEYFNNTIKVFDDDKIKKTVTNSDQEKYQILVKRFLEQADIISERNDKNTKVMIENIILLDKQYVKMNSTTIEIFNDTITFEYTLN
ncbi:MAG: hypothetical protein ACP5N1_02960 [Candidatus Woesearchaeota archaeon]